MRLCLFFVSVFEQCEIVDNFVVFPWNIFLVFYFV